jgi:benzoate membrane transport protein
MQRLEAPPPSVPAEAGAGLVTTLVGFTSSFAVVLTGLAAVGASPAQAASGLAALCLAVGLGTVALSVATRRPITLAWSTPGAALLAGAGSLPGGFSDAVGAFLLCAAAIVVTGLWPRLGELVARIPAALAQAMLAGVLLPLCLAPITAAAAAPTWVLPTLVLWVAGLRWWQRWAVPVAFAGALVTVGVAFAAGQAHVDAAALTPSLVLVAPSLSWPAVVGVALPLYIVTMASQNVPGVAVLASLGYSVPWRASLVVTGAGSALAGVAGGHAINLAAISAALAAGEESGVARERRWRSAVWAGGFYLVLAAGAAAVAGIALAAPGGLLGAVAGVALIATLGGAVQGAWADAPGRVAVVATFLVAASGVSIAGIGAAFWALVVGLVLRAVLRPRAVAA